MKAILVGTMAMLSLVACGGPEGSVATLRFDNGQSDKSQSLHAPATSADEIETPSAFAIRLLAVYLAEDVDPLTQRTVGQTSMIYLNPACAEDEMHCDISGGTAQDGAPITNIASNFHELAANTESLNAELLSQQRTVESGTYRYAHLVLCQWNTQKAANVAWSAEGVSEREFRWKECALNTERFEAPLHVSANNDVSVTLRYDPKATLTRGADATGIDCVEVNGERVCMNLPNFQPTAEITE